METQIERVYRIIYHTPFILDFSTVQDVTAVQDVSVTGTQDVPCVQDVHLCRRIGENGNAANPLASRHGVTRTHQVD